LFKKIIEAAVEKALDRRTVRPDKKLTLEGYHPLSEIMGALYEWLLIPFYGTEILVEVRYPRSTQLPEVDKLFSVIKNTKNKTKYTRQEIIEFMNVQEQCCKAILNRPTFDELEKEIHGKDNVLSSMEKRFVELETLLKKHNGIDRADLHKELDEVEMFTGFILPDDTMITLTNIALGLELQDIRKLTKDKLIAAYCKAKIYNGRPSDYISGLFTDGDRKNIDDYATFLGLENNQNRDKRY
jgi:hypothetical protein